MKIALFHDLCEAYAGDITTLLYHPQLSREKDKEKRKKIEMKWARLSHQERSKIGKIKFEKEKKAILKLLNILGSNSKTKKEMFSLWIDYEKGVISYWEYQSLLKQRFGNKSESHWLNYYDSYIKDLENKLPKTTNNRLLIVSILLIMSLGILLFNN